MNETVIYTYKSKMKQIHRHQYLPQILPVVNRKKQL